MKKKVIIAIIVVCVLVGAGLLVYPKAVGNMKHSFAEATTSSSSFSFSGRRNEKIKFSFASDIKSGDLVVTLRDSKGAVIYELDDAKKLETFYTLAVADTYKVVAEYEEFIGDFKVAVYSTK